MKRYSVLPVTLYRLQPKTLPILRQKSAQLSKGRTSFDFILGPNKLYNPAEGDTYKVPNGLSLRPLGANFAKIYGHFQGEFIYELHQGLVIPDNFVVIHERSDHYSLQTKKPIKPKDFCLLVEQFFENQKRITELELKKKMPIRHSQ